MRGREEVDVMLGTTKKLRRLALLLGGVGMLGITVLPAHADQPPPELKMILAPGQGSSDVITFSADEGDKTVIKEAMPETSRTAAPVSSKGATTSSPKTAGQAAAELTPMTVLPAEATAESAEQRAELVSGKARIRHESYEPSVSLGVGYRWDNLEWGAAVGSELFNVKIEDDDSLLLSGGFRWSNDSNVYIRGKVDVGVFQDGDGEIATYDAGPPITREKYFTDTDDGGLLDASLGVGYRFDVPLQSSASFLRVMPLVGLSYHRQEFDLTDFASTYESTWFGPWIGLDLELILDKQHSLLASVEYHWMDFEGDGDFGNAFQYEQDADGDGFAASVAYKYTISPQWYWTIGFQYSKFETDSGDWLFRSPSNVIVGVGLDEVEWESYAFMIGIGFKF